MIAIIMCMICACLYTAMFTSLKVRISILSKMFLTVICDVINVTTIVSIYAVFGIYVCILSIVIIETLTVMVAMKVKKDARNPMEK